MSTADKDGRIAQWLSDGMACLGMEIHESLLDAQRRLAQLLDNAADDDDLTDEDEPLWGEQG